MARALKADVTLHRLVETRAELSPATAAIIAEGVTYDYAALDARARSFAGHFQQLGVEPDDRVGIFAAKSFDTVAAIIGVLKCGAAYVPIDPKAPVARVDFITQHCGIRVMYVAGAPARAFAKRSGPVRMSLVAEPKQVALLKDVASTVVSSDDASEFATQDVSPATLAYVLYTSGSTGKPKGVAITHENSLAFVEATKPVFVIKPNDVLASHAPFNFDLSIIDLFCAFEAGAAVCLIKESWLAFPAKLASLIAEAPITVWNSVPSALVQLVDRVDLGAHDLSKLRLVMFAGERFPPHALEGLRAALPDRELLNVYGQTEANSSTHYLVKERPEDPLPIGQCFPGYEIVLVGDDGSIIDGQDLEGEMYVVSRAVARGYWDDHERTSAAFVTNPKTSDSSERAYRTGDRAVRRSDGNLVFRGRRDRAVKVRGFRVELAEVEAALSAVDGIVASAVVALPDPDAGHRLVAFVVGESSESEVKKSLAERLPKYMLPTQIRFKAKLPATSTGKIDRRTLTGEAASETAE